MRALGDCTILWRHLRDPVEDGLQSVGPVGALLALGAQFGGALLHCGALLHRGALLGAETTDSFLAFFAGILGLPFDAQGLGVIPSFRRKTRPGHTVALLDF
jgi:hypothetical protein